MRVAVGLLLVIALSHAAVPEDWTQFKAAYGKTYKNQFEELFRMNVYKQNKGKIEEHNKRYENGEVSFNLKMNHFGDLMQHEFKAMMNGFKRSSHSPAQNAGNLFKPTRNLAGLPTAMDWRAKGAVTAVKDQGQCGSCWAFSTTGSLEGQLFMKNKQLVSLSEQQLVDCSTAYGNQGCNGGLMDQSFQYIKDNKGIDSESSYAYEAEDDTCRFKTQSVAGTDKGYVDIPSGDEEALLEAVATVGPVSVAIDAGNLSFQFYSEGIYDEPWCSDSALDHGVLAVGYGSDNGKDYWLVKNSWNTVWGMEGYIKMSRNKSNQCGIATQASYPLV